MLQEEFSQLILMYQKASEGELISVRELFQKSLAFIENLKQQIAKGDQEDKQAAIQMMGQLHQHMQNHTRAMCKKFGMTEQEWLASLDSPENFSPEQWRQMEESKQRLAQSGKELGELLQGQGPRVEKPSQEPKKKKSKKSDWMRG